MPATSEARASSSSTMTTLSAAAAGETPSGHASSRTASVQAATQSRLILQLPSKRCGTHGPGPQYGASARSVHGIAHTVRLTVARVERLTRHSPEWLIPLVPVAL